MINSKEALKKLNRYKFVNFPIFNNTVDLDGNFSLREIKLIMSYLKKGKNDEKR